MVRVVEGEGFFLYGRDRIPSEGNFTEGDQLAMANGYNIRQKCVCFGLRFCSHISFPWYQKYSLPIFFFFF